MILYTLCLFVAAAHAVKVPGPPGSFSVAYQAYPLKDESRWDRYAPKEDPHKRKVMISAYFPVNETTARCGVDTVSYMPPKTTEVYGLYAENNGLPNDTFKGYEFDFCKLPTFNASAPIQKYPLVMFSPGLTASRLLYGAQARALASYGYVVVTVDHPYDATFVEFPDGTTYGEAKPPITNETQCAEATVVRTEDVSFVIDQLQYTTHGKKIAKSLTERIDFDRIVAYGHSLGGATAASVAYSDHRVLGGVDMDGTPYGPVVKHGLTKPFLLTGKALENGIDPSWAPFYKKLDGPKMVDRVTGATHYSYIDAPLLFTTKTIPPELEPVYKFLVGTVPGKRMQGIIMNLLRGLFEFTLEGDGHRLLMVERDFPEVVVSEREIPSSCEEAMKRN